MYNVDARFGFDSEKIVEFKRRVLLRTRREGTTLISMKIAQSF
jgi:hypothetical protein